MCKIRREHLDCSHYVDNYEFCTHRKVDFHTGLMSPCRTMRENDIINVYNVPGYCPGDCWYWAAINKGWRCHVCHFGNVQGYICNRPRCGHQCCHACAVSMLRCCGQNCGRAIQRGRVCTCGHRSCSRCTTILHG
ncbi:hypothetical protein PgNI_06664 [Pyricularia grisea]|uniref:Uncharacterized protein n=1 Tax=Pyricularia grisea TaxID=148305 RepID=A0A6P8B3Z2_PYRGI|nr:hypothetical protein PgNI_06664 [Pyricularia grisea]TLD09993.1 hypothetical protein PgNI_06664 [Pyricularia grisea]